MFASSLASRSHRVVSEFKSTYAIGKMFPKCALIYFRTNLYFLSKRGMENDMHDQKVPKMRKWFYLIQTQW